MSLKTALRAALAAAALAAALAPSAGANVQVGSSGWQWGNPLPQGNTLRAMSFAGATGYAAGDFGTLLKTTDGGTTWSGLPVGTFAGLTVVQALDASTVFAGGGCVARRSTDGGRSFAAVRFTAVESGCRVGLRDLSFVTRDTGYLLLADGSVYATTDGGTRFAPRTAVPETRAASALTEPRAIAFVDASRGYASTAAGTIFQTLDGGVSWRVVADPRVAINDIAFVDPQHGFAVGNGGMLQRTVDGGASWEPKGIGLGAPDYTAISCSSAQQCILSTASGTQLVRTTDGGSSSAGSVTPSSSPVYSAAFASPSRVVAVGANGTTVVSDDAGERFAPIGGRIDGTFTALRAGAAADTAFATGAGGALAKTTDGGRSWSTGDVPTSADLVDVSFPSTAIGYALDADGGLFRTANGGGTWEPLGTGSTRRPRAVLAPDESVVLVVGPRGIRRSADAGETFEQVTARTVRSGQLAGVATAAHGGAIFAWGPTTVARSVDGGRSWTALRKPQAGLRVQQVAFVNTRVGLLLDARGRLWRTIGSGRRWTLLPAVGTERITGMAVRSMRQAYLVVDAFGNRSGGYLLRTGTAGATWQPQFVVDAQIQPSGLAVSRSADYLLAGDASLLFSTTGGVVGSPSEVTVATRSRRLARARRITVTGRLQPAGAGAQVVVSALAPGAGAWSHETVSVASNGTFAAAFHVSRGTTTFVAQWAGDFASAGAGSTPLTVTVGPRHRR